MKKTIIYVLLLVLALGIAGCGSKANEGEDKSFNDLKKIPVFACKDLNGNEVSSAIFADSKLTVVNIWTPT